MSVGQQTRRNEEVSHLKQAGESAFIQYDNNI